jgi:AraC family transcriptional regulator
MRSAANRSSPILSRWEARERHLPASEVDGYFDEVTDRILVFAFATDRMAVDPHAGHLSVKLLASGAERYHFDGRSVLLSPGQVLVMRAGERYGSTIEHRGTRSVSFFLPPREVCDALAGAAPLERALDDTTTPMADIVQAPFRAQGELAQSAQALVAAAGARVRPAIDVLEELVRRVALGAVRTAGGLAPPGALASCARKSTREELVSRVLRARDFVHDRRGRVSLDETARVACLSKYHFLRAFSEVVGTTPAQYAMNVRVSHGAHELLRGSPVSRARRAAGFSSSSAFYRALRRLARSDPEGAAARWIAQVAAGDYSTGESLLPEANTDVP